MHVQNTTVQYLYIIIALDVISDRLPIILEHVRRIQTRKSAFNACIFALNFDDRRQTDLLYQCRAFEFVISRMI